MLQVIHKSYEKLKIKKSSFKFLRIHKNSSLYTQISISTPEVNCKLLN